MNRLPRLILLPLLVGISLSADESSRGSVETYNRFLEYDATQNLISYEVTVRNVGHLPVSFLDLSSEPSCLEGSFQLDDLGSGQSRSRRFSFQIGEDRQLFRPRFRLAFTDFEGQRFRSLPEENPLLATADFLSCDVSTGWTDLEYTVCNRSENPVLFLELRSENPSLAEGSLKAESLAPGETLSWVLEFQLDPGERFFNPTLHLDFHVFQSWGMESRRTFTTFLQPDLRKVESALDER